MVPQGLNFVVGDVMAPTGFLSNALDSFNTEVHVNRFYMEYYESGEVSFAMDQYLFQYISFLCTNVMGILYLPRSASIYGKYNGMTSKNCIGGNTCGNI